MRVAHAIVMVLWTMLVLAMAACGSAPTPTLSPTGTSPAATASRPSPSAVPSARTQIWTPTATTQAFPSVTPTSRPHQFDGVRSAEIITALFPGLKLKPQDAAFIVDNDPAWKMWINSRAEGRFTQSKVPELAVIVANEAPHLTPAQVQKTAPWGSFLAILERSGGKLRVVQKSYPFPSSISPLATDIRIGGVVDFDQDNQDELLITATTTRLGTSTTAAFLYQWNVGTLSELWSASVAEDNTAALNQESYRASSSQIEVKDVDGDAIGEIVVDTTYIDYARTSDGLADLDHEIGHRTERRLFHWDGASFVLDPARSTPLAVLPTPAP